jgi:hypothetical protein
MIEDGSIAGFVGTIKGKFRSFCKADPAGVCRFRLNHDDLAYQHHVRFRAAHRQPVGQAGGRRADGAPARPRRDGTDWRLRVLSAVVGSFCQNPGPDADRPGTPGTD